MRHPLNTVVMSDFKAATASDTFVVLFRLGSESHMLELLHKGHLYLNTLEHFKRLEDGSSRSDRDEATGYYWRMHGGTFEIQHDVDWHLLGTLIGELRVHDSELQAANVYCLHARRRSHVKSPGTSKLSTLETPSCSLPILPSSLFGFAIRRRDNLLRYSAMSPEVSAAIIVGLATLGAAAIGLLAQRWFRHRSAATDSAVASSSQGAYIASPVDGAAVGERIEVTGSFGSLPASTSLFLITSVPDEGLYWPQAASQPLKLNPAQQTWRGIAHIGGDCRLSVVSAGPSAEALFAYYERVGALTHHWHAIDRLPPDIMFHHSIWVRYRP